MSSSIRRLHFLVLRLPAICGLLLLIAASGLSGADEPSLLATLEISGTTRDKSALANDLADGTPANLFGGWGSGITALGNDRYLLLADRGPRDGATEFRCRMHVAQIKVLEHPARIDLRLLSTVLLTSEHGQQLIGLDTAVGGSTSAPTRFDPEGVAFNGSTGLFISDEYGPSICEFDLSGRRKCVMNIPAAYIAPTSPNDARPGDLTSATGCLRNRGFEGLTISSDGRKLYAISQSALAQDGGYEGRWLRLLELDTTTGASKQFGYRLSDAKHVISELLWAGDEDLLVLERDTRRGKDARSKSIYRVLLGDAEDVSHVPSLRHAPKSLSRLRKKLLIDLLDPKHGLAGQSMPGKLEGLAWAAPLADGRRVLLVTSDNDFYVREPTRIYAFAVRADLFGPSSSSR